MSKRIDFNTSLSKPGDPDKKLFFEQNVFFTL